MSDEWAGNLGRILGGLAATGLPVSSLVLTGLGRRYGINTIGNVRGQAVENLIVEFLMDPKLAMAATENYPMLNANKKKRLLDRAKIWAQQRFISDNVRRVQRFGERPGTLFEIGAGASGMREPDEVDEPGGVGPQSSLQAPQAPIRRMASNVASSDAPSPASTLSQVNPLGPPPSAPPPRPTGQASQVVAARGRELFGANDTVFAAHGGYITGGAGSGVGRMEESGIMSVKRKPRQLVG